jgi:predicted DNA-binding protein
MSGYYIKEPVDEIKNVRIGDMFDLKINFSQSNTYKVLDIDDEYVYTFNYTNFENEIDSLMRFKKSGYFVDSPMKKHIDELENFLIAYIKEHTNNRRVSDELKSLYATQFINGGKDNSYGTEEISDSDINQFNDLYNKFIDDCIQYNKDENEYFVEKYNKIPQKLELANTWTYYENKTVITAITDMGYGGYVAKENSENTYNIFNPKKSVKILSHSKNPDDI